MKKLLFSLTVCFVSFGLPHLSEAKTLRDLAEDNNMHIGFAVIGKTDSGNGLYKGCKSTYCNIVAREATIIVPENDSKMERLLLSTGNSSAIDASLWTWNWTKFDNILEFAKENGIKVRGHVLFWGGTTGRGFSGSKALEVKDPALKRKNLIQLMNLYAKEVFKHAEKIYPGGVIEWDVVNEAYHSFDCGETEAGKACPKIAQVEKDNLFHATLGADWIRYAFEAAHLARTDKSVNRPDILLAYNDFQDMRAICDALANLKSKYIQAVGRQSHVGTDASGSYINTFKRDLYHCAKRGFKTRITELDREILVPLGYKGPETERKHASQSELDEEAKKKFKVQGELYRAAVEACLDPKSNCDMVLAWGLYDGIHWGNEWKYCKIRASGKYVDVPNPSLNLWGPGEDEIEPGSCRQTKGWGLPFTRDLQDKDAYDGMFAALSGERTPGSSPKPSPKASPKPSAKPSPKPSPMPSPVPVSFKTIYADKFIYRSENIKLDKGVVGGLNHGEYVSYLVNFGKVGACGITLDYSREAKTSQQKAGYIQLGYGLQKTRKGAHTIKDLNPLRGTSSYKDFDKRSFKFSKQKGTRYIYLIGRNGKDIARLKSLQFIRCDE